MTVFKSKTGRSSQEPLLLLLLPRLCLDLGMDNVNAIFEIAMWTGKYRRQQTIRFNIRNRFFVYFQIPEFRTSFHEAFVDEIHQRVLLFCIIVTTNVYRKAKNVRLGACLTLFMTYDL
jgi:hypothetical protein